MKAKKRKRKSVGMDRMGTLWNLFHKLKKESTFPFNKV